MDLNPHQVEAALFALRSPFSRGIIEADEVGLGKTIVGGIVVAQKWAEDKKRILIIVPASLRRQWQMELEEKFYLSSVIMDGDAFRNIATTQKNPFIQNEIVIVSYDFAHAKAEFIKEIEWDIVLLDEAHKMRNVYKPNNVQARSIRDAIRDSFKLLLTATPLQNSMMELYGLVSFIDDYAFGDADSFKAQFTNIRDEKQATYSDLVARLKLICTRTLRQQVQEYIKYTERLPITQEFIPTSSEQELYDKLTKYLQRAELWALSSGGRHFITLVLWKQLASSTFAVAGTLNTLINRLEATLADGHHGKATVKLDFGDDISLSDYEIEALAPITNRKKLTENEKISLQAEIDELKSYYNLATGITSNAKGEALLVALEKGFDKLKELNAPQKTVIFTESRRTQEYLYRILESTQYKGKIVLYHGGMTQKKQEEAKEHFKNDAGILLATESAAEGLNLQYCAMVINYDLPWNPQRIEQRIGRCHRYGQKFDVVVINFLNKNNIADQRVYELLCDKFQLFEGIFGASNSVLGMIDELDFEKRIIEIYQQCRTAEEIEKSFAELKESLSPQIDAQISTIKQKLMENFDEEVIKRLKISQGDSVDYVNKFENMLWAIAKHRLTGGYVQLATFDDENRKFEITAVWKQNPWYKGKYNYKRLWGEYEMSKTAPLDKRFRLKGALAQTLLFDYMYGSISRFGSVCFDLTGYKGKFSNLEALIGQEGYLTLYNTEIIYTSRRENRLVFAGFTQDGKILDQKQAERMFELSGETSDDYEHDINKSRAISDKLKALYTAEEERLLEEISIQNSNYFEEETTKLAKWSKDIKIGIERNLRDIDKAIDEVSVQLRGRNLPLQKRLDLEEQLAILEPKRTQLRKQIFEEQDKIDLERNRLIEETKKKLTQRVESKHIFTVKWRII